MKSEFNPQNNYTWKMEDRFEMSGKELGVMLNAFRTVLSSEKAQEILIINEANKQADAILRRGYELGIVKDAEPSPTTPTPNPIPPFHNTSVEDIEVEEAEVIK